MSLSPRAGVAALAVLCGCGLFRTAARPPELVDSVTAYEQAIAEGGEQGAKYEPLLRELKVFRARAAMVAKLTPDAVVKRGPGDEGGAPIGRYGTWFIDAADGTAFRLRATAYAAKESAAVLKAEGRWSKVPLLRASAVRVRMDVDRAQQPVDLCLFSSSSDNCANGYRVTVGNGGYNVASPTSSLCSLKPSKGGGAIHQQRALYVGPGNNAYPYTRLEVDALHGQLRVAVNGTEICREAVAAIGKRAGHFLVNSALYTFEFPRGSEPVFVDNETIVSVAISPEFPKAELGGDDARFTTRWCAT